MKGELTRQMYIRALVLFGIILLALAIIGLACPVAALRWDFWALLVIVVVGLLVSLILVLFAGSAPSGDDH